ncbi:MAG: response regulator [Actinomycetota bacterium]
MQVTIPRSPEVSENGRGRIRVLLADQHALVTSSLRTVIELAGDIEVVGEASTHRSCVEKTAASHPDVVVMELVLVEGGGVEAIREIVTRFRDARVLVLTSDDDESSLLRAMEAGASGYLLKRSRSAEVVHGIRLTANGESVVDPRLAGSILLDRAHVAGHALEALTPRERRVLAGVARGKTNREIAEELHFSERTIKNVVSQAMAKIGARRRSEAAALFARHAGAPTGPGS